MKSVISKLNRWADEYPLAVYVCLIIGAGVGMWQVEDTRSDSQGQNEKTLGSIIAVQIENCQNDRRFREQYRKRGEAEKALIELFLQLARRNVAEGNDPSGDSRAFLRRFGPLAREIHVIPVPDCREVGKSLREVIQNTGVDVPPIPELENLITPSRRGEVPTKQPSAGREPPAPGFPGARGGKEPPNSGSDGGLEPGKPGNKDPKSTPDPPPARLQPPLAPPSPGSGTSPEPPGPVEKALEQASDVAKGLAEQVGGAACSITNSISGTCLK